jgi:hypothetical protein
VTICEAFDYDPMTLEPYSRCTREATMAVDIRLEIEGSGHHFHRQVCDLHPLALAAGRGSTRVSVTARRYPAPGTY